MNVISLGVEHVARSFHLDDSTFAQRNVQVDKAQLDPTVQSNVHSLSMPYNG